MIIITWTVRKTTGISLDTVNFKLQILCAAPLYVPV